MQNEWHIIGRGIAGWHAQGINVSSSGGDLMPYKYWTGKQCTGYLHDAIEGALVYDADHLRGTDAVEAFAHFVISGPMVKPELTTDESATALGYVTVATFKRLLKESVPGVKVGHVRNGAIVWDA